MLFLSTCIESEKALHFHFPFLHFFLQLRALFVTFYKYNDILHGVMEMKWCLAPFSTPIPALGTGSVLSRFGTTLEGIRMMMMNMSTSCQLLLFFRLKVEQVGGWSGTVIEVKSTTVLFPDFHNTPGHVSIVSLVSFHFIPTTLPCQSSTKKVLK